MSLRTVGTFGKDIFVVVVVFVLSQSDLSQSIVFVKLNQSHFEEMIQRKENHSVLKAVRFEE